MILFRLDYFNIFNSGFNAFLLNAKCFACLLALSALIAFLILFTLKYGLCNVDLYINK